MSTSPQFNPRSPTIKRILKEASELAHHPSTTHHAAPLDNNLFEWHFTLTGPPSTPYAPGIYHGRITLPPTYPLRPPSFRFLTPSGRFEVNREICLSISGHHEETWQPAWGIRTALVALRAFMAGDARGQLGGLDASPAARARLARESGAWRCAACGRENAEVMREQVEAAAEAEAEAEAEVGEGSRTGTGAGADGNTVRPGNEPVIPEGLRLGYREDLGGGGGGGGEGIREGEAGGTVVHSSGNAQPQHDQNPQMQTHQERDLHLQPQTQLEAQPQPQPQPHPHPRPQPHPQPQHAAHLALLRARERRWHSHWLDMAIVGVAAALAALVIRKVVVVVF